MNMIGIEIKSDLHFYGGTVIIKKGTMINSVTETYNKEGLLQLKFAEHFLFLKKDYYRIFRSEVDFDFTPKEQEEHEIRELNSIIQEKNEEIEELKAKLPQPVEISRELADAIEWAKKKNPTYWQATIFDKVFWFESPHTKLTTEFTYNFCVEIIKNGYTIKPDPLREGIASLVARYTNEDGVSGETDLIEKLAEYVRSHFKTSNTFDISQAPDEI